MYLARMTSAAKYLTLLLGLFVSSTASASGFVDGKKNLLDTLVIEGTYNGTNLFVFNPSRGDVTWSYSSFTIQEIFVNKSKISNGRGSSAIEIDFSAMNLKKGDTVIVELVYYSDKACKVLNAEVL